MSYQDAPGRRAKGKAAERFSGLDPADSDAGNRGNRGHDAGVRSRCRERRSPEVEHIQGGGRHDYKGQENQGKTLEQARPPAATAATAAASTSKPTSTTTLCFAIATTANSKPIAAATAKAPTARAIPART